MTNRIQKWEPAPRRSEGCCTASRSDTVPELSSRFQGQCPHHNSSAPATRVRSAVLTYPWAVSLLLSPWYCEKAGTDELTMCWIIAYGCLIEVQIEILFSIAHGACEGRERPNLALRSQLDR